MVSKGGKLIFEHGKPEPRPLVSSGLPLEKGKPRIGASLRPVDALVDPVRRNQCSTTTTILFRLRPVKK
jgi:hypothetical protein